MAGTPVEIILKCELVFDDWRVPSGKSIYQTEEGVELSMGLLHSGSKGAEAVFHMVPGG